MRGMMPTSRRAGRLPRMLAISSSYATCVVAILSAVAFASLVEVQRINPDEAGDAVPNPRTMLGLPGTVLHRDLHTVEGATVCPLCGELAETIEAGENQEARLGCHRWYQTVTPLPDGRVLINGGLSSVVRVGGSCDTTSDCDHAEICDVRTTTWR